MLIHLVLFEPRPDLPTGAARDLLASIEQAARRIPSVRSFQVGRRLADGPGYRASAPAPSFVAIVGFDDRAGLEAYLADPAHAELGRLFNQTLASATVGDYDTWDAGNEMARLLET